MGALTRPVAVCETHITAMTAHVKRKMRKIGEEHRLVQRLHQDFLETTYQSLLARPKTEAGYFLHRQARHSKQSWTKNIDACRNVTLSITIRVVTGTCSTSPEGSVHGKQNSKLRKRPDLEDSGESSMEPEAVRQ